MALLAAACADGSDVGGAVNENAPGSAPQMTPEEPSSVPFSAAGDGPLPAPGDSEGQEPEPNATETNFLVFVCWEDSDCLGGFCQLYASDAGAEAARQSAREDAGTPQDGQDVDRSGPPLGRCRIP